ncbi:hypothetical protein J2Z48_001969 [Croceifilum oryzae]|uniref:Sulfotransferase family protein n=1 Tax=Croceifilum oryzae TaxID=1553429 RepID=A0AAJ1TNN2_9BACL|nr:sulfotransferase family 2 domain-containing protein [Croceifilum oryzae]MDQ0417796.1 hypothetical protein [Croceifilum oryzae]
MKKPLWIFAHIPKTGGITMRGIIDSNVPSNQIYRYPLHQNQEKMIRSLTSKQKENFRWVYGHCRYGVHQHFHRSYRYITMLRDPVSRVISTYYFICSMPTNGLHHKVKKMSLEEFVTSQDPRISAPLHNHQTRFLSGQNDPDLTLAMNNLNDHFAFVGITEMYPQSVFLLNQLQGWKQTHYSKENVTKKRPKRPDISEQLTNHIRSMNELDYHLYETCKLQLHQKIKSLSQSEKKELRSFIKMQD